MCTLQKLYQSFSQQGPILFDNIILPLSKINRTTMVVKLFVDATAPTNDVIKANSGA